MLKQILILAVVSLFLCLPLSATAFSDVKTTDWFYDSVMRANETGFMIGTGDTTFSPTAHITGAEGVTMLARVYATVKDDNTSLAKATAGVTPWYTGYVSYCRSAGLLDETAYAIVNLSLSTPLTRAELLYLFSALPDSVFTQKNTVDDGMIPDLPAGAYYRDAVYRAYRAGITVGTDSRGTFQPDSPISRAEVAAIVIRLTDVSRRQSVFLPFDAKQLLNSASLSLKSTGYTVLDNLVDAAFKKLFTPGMTTYDKVAACYDYLAENGIYGSSNVSGAYRSIYKQNPYIDPAPDLKTKPTSVLVGYRGYDYYYIAVADHALEGYTAMYATEMLAGMRGRCDHYSSAFSVMMQRLGLDCFPVYINSKLGKDTYAAHMTSVMNVGGVDCVFDPQIEQVLIGNTGKNEHKRFCRPISEMTEEYHNWDELEVCRALIGDFAYDKNKMTKINVDK